MNTFIGLENEVGFGFTYNQCWWNEYDERRADWLVEAWMAFAYAYSRTQRKKLSEWMHNLCLFVVAMVLNVRMRDEQLRWEVATRFVLLWVRQHIMQRWKFEELRCSKYWENEWNDFQSILWEMRDFNFLRLPATIMIMAKWNVADEIIFGRKNTKKG